MSYNSILNSNQEIQTEQASLLKRSDIDDKYKWDLSHIYKTDADWENDFKWVENNLAGYKKFKGLVGQDSENLLKCLQFDDSIGIKLERLYLYAMLSKDSDMKVPVYQSMDERIKSLSVKLSAESSFIKPEILNIPSDTLREMIATNQDLNVYAHYLDDLSRFKAHTLSEEGEKILALSGELSMTPYNVFSMMTNADLKFPVIQDDCGNDIEITHGRYYAAMYSKDREYRERAFKNYLKPYTEFNNTFMSLFNGNLKANVFNARARNYSSALETSLSRNNIPVSVYENLIKTVNENLKPLHRWAEIKKKILGLDELHPYDVYVTLFSVDKEKKYSFDEAKGIVLESLKPLGNDYLASIKKAFNNRWIDVYETPSKRSGAYSSGTTFGVHPYVLLNWTDLLNDVFTLTHEMGHNMHSYYTGQTQPYIYANYSIFLAEVASTFNEALLLEYLITNTKSKHEKLFLVEKYLNNITSTFYRQVMFAEFEKVVYEKTEAGEALTAQDLCGIYSRLFKKYWGESMVVDEEESYSWARIPHFYYNFYVFQYATGFAASEVLSNKIKLSGEQAVEKYLNFLKAGNSDYSINILRDAGVDMSSSTPVQAVAAKMNLLLDELEL
ncbi:MAG: oligoendopeptidase F [Ignavibacteriales bacterium]|nr:MAG: oligoendopeptidase F [Ignavibacteriales bacterium]